MVEQFPYFDILAHFDRILLRGNQVQRFDPHHFEAAVRDALTAIVWHGCALELNMRFLDQGEHWREAVVTMLRWFREQGGRRITINSDAHQVLHLTENEQFALDILEQAELTPTRLTF